MSSQDTLQSASDQERRRQPGRRLEDRLLASQAREGRYYKLIVESSADAIQGAALDGHIQSWNGGAEHMFGYGADEILGRHFELLAPVDRQAEMRELFGRVCKGESVLRHETVSRRKDGTLLRVTIDAFPVREADGTIDGIAWIARDITDEWEAEQALQQSKTEFEHAAVTDPLTGCANRRGLEQALDRELRRSSRYGHKLAVLMADLDYFKAVNDQFGHAVGDSVLRMLARTIESYIRDTDLLARFGGDEFVILMPESTSAEAAQAAERIRAKMAQTILFPLPRAVTVSIGVIEAEPGDAPESLLRRVDRALYQAKSSGRNRVSCLG